MGRRMLESGEFTGTHQIFVRGGLLLASVLLVSALGGSAKRADAVDHAALPNGETIVREMRGLTEKLQAALGELAMVRLQLERADAVLSYSTKYKIPADLSAAIYDIALSEGIDPSLAFRLVKVESNFISNAKSTASAFGYTQIQLPTARFYEAGLEERHLYERDVNLRLGFRFLKDLLEKYDNDLELALLAYNRGPARVEQILAQGGNPANGYAAAVLKGYRAYRAKLEMKD